MIFTEAKASYIPQKPGMQGIYEKIEAGARTCYKSEGYTQYDEDGNSTTAREFANKILNIYKHQSVAEHAAVYLTIPIKTSQSIAKQIPLVANDNVKKFSKIKIITHDDDIICYISTNYRVIIENKLQDWLEYMTNPTEYHEQRHTVRIFTDRGVSAEANRHRANSPSERSTRYVDSVDGLSILLPEDYKGEINEIWDFWADSQGEFNTPLQYMCNGILYGELCEWTKLDWWLFANLACERAYNEMRVLGCEKQEARRILPMDIETEEVISAFESDWKHFLDLRLLGTTGKPHPDMKHIAYLIARELEPHIPWIKDYIS